MTDEQIKQWARAAGLANQYVTAEMLAMFRRMCEFAVLAEREACAQLCDLQHDRARTSTGAARADACAAAIRARGKP